MSRPFYPHNDGRHMDFSDFRIFHKELSTIFDLSIKNGRPVIARIFGKGGAGKTTRLKLFSEFDVEDTITKLGDEDVG